MDKMQQMQLFCFQNMGRMERDFYQLKFITKRTTSKTQFNSDTANIIILKGEKLNKTAT
jgi:hypothetical protein